MCCSGPIHIIQGRQPGNRPPGLGADTPLPAQEEGFALYGLLGNQDAQAGFREAEFRSSSRLSLPAVPPPFAVGFRKLWKMGSST
eukprot:CAMPEP_0113261672 /NCGR_PEP_ID=MMETSP0008_2-20120614/17522_1 /TAXON_ID=97485 /ORGANISM="Prymnesium parvum" /LENGTH=84 /DNA_ID=CAMNT_0000110297 /DNA_START=254 /DNA_END=512 /DNA_ORIENTATION=- /assembly_acc=CAM_ASM_000153